MNLKHVRRVLLGIAALIMHGARGDFTGWMDQISDSLVFSSSTAWWQLQIGGLIDIEALYLDQHPPGLIFAKEEVFFNPRLTLFLDAFAGNNVCAFAKIRADRGLDPGYRENDLRIDEYFVRWTDSTERFALQVGKFATIFGSWAGRHDSWENAFINHPLPYENVTIILDQGAPPNASDWLALRDRNDNKKKWIPVIWGPVYTAGASGSMAFGDFLAEVSFTQAALSSRPPAWEDLNWARPTWTGRLQYSPRPSLALGVSGSTGPYLLEAARDQLPVGSVLEDFKQKTLGWDVSWARGHWQIWNEWIFSAFDVPNVGDVDSLAYYVEGRYKWSPRFFSGFRWGQQIFSEIEDTAGAIQRWDRGIWKIDTSLVWRIDHHVQLKGQYSFSDQNGELEVGQQFAAVQITLKF